MSDTIIGAIIGAVTTIVIAIFGLLLRWRSQVKRQSSIYDEQSSHSFVAGFGLTLLFNNMCFFEKIDSLMPEIENIDTALKNADVSFRVADNLPDIFNAFKYPTNDKNRFIAVGELASKWPDAITKDLHGNNSHLFTLGTILISRLYASAMTKEQLKYFEKKISIAFKNTVLPKKFYSRFRRKMKRMEKPNFSKDDYQRIMKDFSLELLSYIDSHKKESL